MLIVAIILGIIVSLLIYEQSTAKSNVKSLKRRIHVNGTRGKSSVTEYIAAGMFNAHPDVMAKITGIIPTIIHNGIEHTIGRTGVTRVHEQIQIIRYAARKSVKCLVLECMSIDPELQRLESRLFRPHIYVITNIRDDHREEMGRSIEEQANAICHAIPANCIVITNEIRFLNKIKEVASANNSSVISVQELSDEFIKKLPFGIFPENVSLALAVCDASGIPHQLAEEGMMQLIRNRPSPLITVTNDVKNIRFLNAFAVNDVDSTGSFLLHWQKKLGFNGKISLLFNTRADRPIRTDLFAEWISKSLTLIENVIVTGDHINRAKYAMLKAGVDNEKIHIWGKQQLRHVKENLIKTVCDGSLVVGIGNIGGVGFDIIRELK